MESRALLYYTQLTAGDNATNLKSIEALVESGNERWEDDWIDFKEAHDLLKYVEADKNRKKDRAAYDNCRNDFCGKLAKMLSGFVNNEGGVIVWGVEAAKKPDPNGYSRDRATKLHAFENVAACRDALDALSSDVTDPPLSRLLYKEIYQDDDKGFIVVCIPEGSVKPYVCMQPSLRPIYFRSGDESKIASLPLVRMLFQSKKTYRASAAVEYIARKSDIVHEWRLWIRNEEVSTIRTPKVILLTHNGSLQQLSMDPKDAEITRMDVFMIFEMKRNINFKHQYSVRFGSKELKEAPVKVNVRMDIEDFWPMEATFILEIPEEVSTDAPTERKYVPMTVTQLED